MEPENGLCADGPCGDTVDLRLLRCEPEDTGRTAGSCSGEPATFPFPVEVVQPQAIRLASAKTVDGEQQQDGAVPQVCRLVARGHGEQALDIFSGRSPR